MAALCINISEDLKDEIEFVAKIAGVSVDDFVIGAIEQNINLRSTLPEFGPQLREMSNRVGETIARLNTRIREQT